MAYVYKHTRLDNNEIFYIGIGFHSDDNYKRAYDIKGRNHIWYGIIKKTDFIVEILFDDISWEDACKKEIELIRLYGRKTNKSGTLSNLTEGGDGFRKNHTQKSKDKIREFFKGKTYEEIFGDRADSERLKRKKTTRTHEEYLESGKKCSETTKGISKQFKDVVCPYCEKQGGVNVMYRWHFDNCKLKK